MNEKQIRAYLIGRIVDGFDEHQACIKAGISARYPRKSLRARERACRNVLKLKNSCEPSERDEFIKSMRNETENSIEIAEKTIEKAKTGLDRDRGLIAALDDCEALKQERKRRETEVSKEPRVPRRRRRVTSTDE